jgi:hypothetical protein
MKHTIFAAAATFLVTTLSVPAFAQTGSANSDSMANGSAMSSASAMPATCQGMMDKAQGMAMPTDTGKKAMAMKEMDMAKAAMAKNQEKTCMTHMKMAMHDMM